MEKSLIENILIIFRNVFVAGTTAKNNKIACTPQYGYRDFNTNRESDFLILISIRK
jgi:hypothetical protein